LFYTARKTLHRLPRDAVNAAIEVPTIARVRGLATAVAEFAQAGGFDGDGFIPMIVNESSIKCPRKVTVD